MAATLKHTAVRSARRSADCSRLLQSLRGGSTPHKTSGRTVIPPSYLPCPSIKLTDHDAAAVEHQEDTGERDSLCEQALVLTHIVRLVPGVLGIAAHAHL